MFTYADLDKETKDKLRTEVETIILNELYIQKIKPDRFSLNLSISMFIEGIKYWEQKRKEYAKI